MNKLQKLIAQNGVAQVAVLLGVNNPRSVYNWAQRGIPKRKESLLNKIKSSHFKAINKIVKEVQK